jgi:hypothetical protein
MDMDDCRHDDVSLSTEEDYHVITCNQCGRWWRNYMPWTDAWRLFIQYAREDGSEPAMVSINCLPKVKR